MGNTAQSTRSRKRGISPEIERLIAGHTIEQRQLAGLISEAFTVTEMTKLLASRDEATIAKLAKRHKVPKEEIFGALNYIAEVRRTWM